MNIEYIIYSDKTNELDDSIITKIEREKFKNFYNNKKIILKKLLLNIIQII